MASNVVNKCLGTVSKALSNIVVGRVQKVGFAA